MRTNKKITIVALLAAAIVVAWIVIRLLTMTLKSSVTIDTDRAIDITPQQIESIRDIGQWEFLAVSDEELVDTTRRTLLGTDRLVRIYYGTMRIGIDLDKVAEDWLTAQGDTILLTLPHATLLDDRFIDEARTLSFHESGKWSALDREAMYQRARRRMKARGLTTKNLRSAEDNADAQFRQLLRAMGFEHVIIRFQ